MKAIILSALLLISVSAFTQQAVQWPAITKENKPWARWWWQGSGVTKGGLTAAMQQYSLAGLGGLEITPIYGVKGQEDKFIKYLSPQWMEMLVHTLQEAKRLNLGIDMATGTGWPFGGPWVTREDACKNINVKTYSLKTGERLSEKITFRQQPFVRTANGKPVDINSLSFPVAANKDLQAFAFDQVRYPEQLSLNLLMAYSDNGEATDLTAKCDKTGELNWVAPAGNWTLYALFQGWHGKQVERSAPGGEGDVIDHFSVRALQNYLQEFDKAFRGHDVGSIRAFFNDSYEVDDARGQANWTPQLLAEFKSRRGYDLRQHLQALFQREAADHTRVLYDYRLTISELLLEKFTRPWDDWAKSKKAVIRNQSHGSPANILDLYAAIDIPETEGANILRYKFATSTANVMGKPLASAEAATWLNEHFQSSLGDVKLALDKYFVGGVNHIFYHGTNYSPQNEAWPGWLFYAAVHFTPANSFWKDFSALNNYVARVQSFLQKGKPDNDVLLYFPINDRFSEPLAAPRAPARRNPNAYTDTNPDSARLQTQRSDTADRNPGVLESGIDMPNLLQHFDGMEGFDNTVFESSAEHLLKEGYAFDLISDNQLLQVRSAGRKLQTGGISYQTILLSDCRYVPVSTLAKLVKLAAGGATVIFFKNPPSDVPGYGHLDKNKAEFTKLMEQLKFAATENPSVKKAAVGIGAFLLGNDLDELLAFAKILREAMVDQGLLFVRRLNANGQVYFVSNGGNKALEAWVPLSVKVASVTLFDPMFEKKGLAKTRQSATGRTEIFLRLAAGESCLLQTSSAVVKDNPFPYVIPDGKPETLDREWEISFKEGGPVLPATSRPSGLGSWTDLPGDDVKKFSGTAQYSTSLKKPVYTPQAWLLDLGRVGESAEVFLNGRKLGTLIGPAYQLVIPSALLKADNLLQVNVTNGMANRIADLDKRGVEWKKFYNVNFPSRLAENRNASGLFDASKWSPKPSGLMGPVTITPVKYSL